MLKFHNNIGVGMDQNCLPLIPERCLAYLEPIESYLRSVCPSVCRCLTSSLEPLGKSD